MPSSTNLANISVQSSALREITERGASVCLEHDRVVLGLPPFAGTWMATLRELVPGLFSRCPVYMVILDTFAFPNHEVPGLYERVRDSAGVSQGIFEAPVDVFHDLDREYFLCLAFVALANVWDVALFNSDESCVIVFSHDEWFCILEGSVETSQLLESIVRSSGGRRLRRRERRQLYPKLGKSEE